MKFAKKEAGLTKPQQKSGFTLAEILITLGVIGIVALLVIPQIVGYYQEREAVAKVKETYAMVSEAVKQWENEIGCIGGAQKCMNEMPWNWGTNSGNNYEDGMEMRLAWTKYLKVIDRRPRNRTVANTSWINYQNYRIDGTETGNGASNGTYMGVSKWNEAHRVFHYLLANGVVLAISSAVGDFIWIDTNGPKRPNRVGKDQFPIGFSRGWNKNYGIIPYHTECTWLRSSAGICSHNCPDPCNPDDGRSPTAYVLKYNKLPNLQEMGYPASP